jgi:hypothetical protein
MRKPSSERADDLSLHSMTWQLPKCGKGTEKEIMVSQVYPASVESLGPDARAAREDVRLTDPDLAESAAKIVAAPLPVQRFLVDIVEPWLQRHPEHMDSSTRDFLDALIAEHPEDYRRLQVALGKPLATVQPSD